MIYLCIYILIYKSLICLRRTMNYHGTINKFQFWIIVVVCCEHPIQSYGLDVVLIDETEVFTQSFL